MIIPDPVYGAMDLPEWLQPVISSPEVQRLRQVRLLNSAPLGLPALSDVRRFTHTLGALNLASRIESRLQRDYGLEERKAFLAAIVLHDVGTPPFGHSFEYLLQSISGWSHEGALKSILAGSYRPENRYAQIYYGAELSLGHVLKELGVPTHLVTSYVQGREILGPAISGSVDLDNIDNVFRMAQALGLPTDFHLPLDIVDAVEFDARGLTWSPEAPTLLERWRLLRKDVYRVLAFDESNMQGQAMLSDALSEALQHGLIGEENWYWSDEELLRRLEAEPLTRDTVRRLQAGRPFNTILISWFGTSPDAISDFRQPIRRAELENSMDRALGQKTCVYVFYDRGTFEKKLDLRVRQASGVTSAVTLGSRSESVIVGVFARLATPVVSSRDRKRALDVLQDFGLEASAILPIPTKRDIYGLPGQAQLPL